MTEPVQIDGGLFKYVLIEAATPAGQTVTLLRGFIGCEFHADVLERATPALQAAGYTSIQCTGGGRIRHDRGSTIFIYGYSQGYGQGDHAKAQELCREAYGEDYEITWSNEGY